MKSFGIIIPSRYGSTRLPGKPLADINGQTLIQRVLKNAQQVKNAAFVAVATDDERIFNHVNAFGKAILTSPNHVSGTDRIRECLEHINDLPEVIINIQGDEPFLNPQIIIDLVRCFDISDCQIATAYHNIDSTRAASPDIVKLTVDKKDKALYFSRSLIPFPRNKTLEIKAHMGVYAYRTQVLKEITDLEPSALEQSESLEQLRWLENGYSIYCIKSETPSIGIDTEEDLLRARQLFS